MSFIMLNDKNAENKVSYNSIYALAILSTVALILLNQGVIQYWLGQKKADAKIVNVSGKQRMLSQRISNLLYSYHLQPQPSIESELNNLYAEWEHAHLALSGQLTNDSQKGLDLALESEEILKELAALTPLIGNVKKGIAKIDELTLDEIRVLEQNQLSFLTRMDEVVNAIQKTSEEKLSFIIRIELMLACLALLFIFIEFQFVFRRINKNLVRQNEALKSSKTTLEQYAYIASHDLRTPLQNILNFSNLLSVEVKDRLSKTERKYFHFLKENVVQMQGTTEDLLRFTVSSHEAVQKKLVDANKVVKDVLGDIASVTDEKKAVINVEKMPEAILVDDRLFRQLIQNLLTNAVKFVPPSRSPIVHISAERKNKHVTFKICDNGLGIREEHQQKIFELFNKLHTRQEYKGTGLGLALCKKIVERHGGQIWLESEEGKGSTFYFDIPEK